jgi:DNA-binding IclR family transcriptional regulator
MRTADWTASVTVLDRLTAVLEAFGPEDVGLGVSEIARRANLPKSTVSRIAADLARQGCLDNTGGKLSIGVRLFELGNAVEAPRVLREAALPVMAELREATGHSAYVAVVDEEDTVTIAIMRGDATAGPSAAIGGRRPSHSTALGRAVRRCTGEWPVARTTECVVELDDASETICVASPILGPGAVPVAALAIVGGSDLNIAVGSRDVQAAAHAVSRRLAAIRAR